MPPDLLEFQREFAGALDCPAAGALAVYRNTVLKGAVEALRDNYPVVEQLLGTEMFDAIAVDFATRRPPPSPVLALYGDAFAGWLEEQPWIADLPYLADVARIERLRLECLMAADAQPLTSEQVRRACRPDGGRVCLHPAVRFAWLSTPAMSIWLAHQRGFEAELEPEWQLEGALFARPTPFDLHAPRIGRAAHRLLSGIGLGETLDASLAAAAALYPAEDCTAILASLVNLGVFAAPAAQRKD